MFGVSIHLLEKALLTHHSYEIALIPPTIYYSRVGLELGKLVFRGQNMTPP